MGDKKQNGYNRKQNG